MAHNINKLSFLRNKPLVLLALAILVILAAVALSRLTSSRTGSADTGNFATFTVQSAPLRISVTESGTIKAREQVILKSEVEGRTSILTLIPEGTRVKKGDLLVGLDASQLLDNKVDQEIRVQNNQASFISAEENMAVAENQAQSDNDKAKLTLDFAQQDLKQYLEGEYPKQIKERQAQITLAKEELNRAVDKLDWSEKLYAQQYISQTDLQTDKLAKSRKELDLELARGDLDLLMNFTYHRNLKQLQSDVKQAGMALERTKRKARADIKQAEANLKAKESEYNRQTDKLKKIEEQIVKTKIYAPADGLVIYATSAQRGGWRRSNTEPLDEGQEVRERQELIYLPTGTTVNAEVDIHEASLIKVRLGLPVIITVDALPGKRFVGRIGRIAPLPDAQSRWMNPDLKVYNTEIYLEGNDGSLRTGMSCKAEIVIETYEEALFVPVQAVLRIAGNPHVFVAKGKNYESREVEIGLDNNRMVHITGGLAEGEIVLLTPPLKSGEVKPADEEFASGTSPADENSDDVADKVNERLKEMNGSVDQKQAGPASEGGNQRDKKDSERGQGRRGFGNLSPEEMEKMRQRYENMTPEEKEKLRQQMQGQRQGRGQGRGRGQGQGRGQD